MCECVLDCVYCAYNLLSDSNIAYMNTLPMISFYHFKGLLKLIHSRSNSTYGIQSFIEKLVKIKGLPEVVCQKKYLHRKSFPKSVSTRLSIRIMSMHFSRHPLRKLLESNRAVFDIDLTELHEIITDAHKNLQDSVRALQDQIRTVREHKTVLSHV